MRVSAKNGNLLGGIMLGRVAVYLQHAPFLSALVLVVLVVALVFVLILVAVLILIVVLVLILVVHGTTSNFLLRNTAPLGCPQI